MQKENLNATHSFINHGYKEQNSDILMFHCVPL